MSMIILQKYQKENNSEIYSPISFTPIENKNIESFMEKSKGQFFIWQYPSNLSISMPDY